MEVREEVKVGGRSFGVSNLPKVMYPAVGFTKAALIDYYYRMAPMILPHLKDRPLTLKRYPDGVEGDFFYEKQCPAHRPPWIHTVEIPGNRGGRSIQYCLVDTMEALVWVANLGTIELHPSLSRKERMAVPSVVVFDLDPGEGVGLRECAQVALWVRHALADLGLSSFVKTSGAKGLQVYVPINCEVTYGETKRFAHLVAETLEQVHPQEVVSRMATKLRRGKVFIDWSQNDQHKTTVGVYSLRARTRPTVSTPLDWPEVERAVKRNDMGRLVFDAEQVLRRCRRKGDLFEPVLYLRQELPPLGGEV
jgi:bifunctional non-homologous end joining protein LigD